MIRLHVQLTPAQDRRVRQAALRDGVSVAEALRRFLDRGLAVSEERARLYARAALAVGRYRARTGEKDVALEHDHFLDGAFLT
jgi:hypothetical protein